MNEQAPAGQGTSTSGDESKNQYSAEFVDKLKREKDNYVKAKAELESKLSELQKTITTREEQELKSKEEWKKLYEAEKARAEKVTGDFSHLQTTVKQRNIDSEIEKELFKLGLKPEFKEEALKLIDRSIIAVDPETHVVVGVDAVTQSFLKKFQHVGFFKQGSSSSNHAAAQGTGNGRSYDVNKMSQDEKIKMLQKLHRK